MTFQSLTITAFACLASSAYAATTWDYHDWTATFTSTAWLYGNTSSAGTISGSSNHPGFGASPGSWGVPYAITNNNTFTNEFQIHGTSGLGNDVTFNFSSGYQWGTGGRLFIGNIHVFYEYQISAWDFSNNPINVNTWTTVTEYQSSAPGTSGYFSTSSTTRTASGNSSLFSVYDTSVNPNFGQGGVVLLDGLVNVGRIELKLTNSALAPNAQQVDFMLFNVGTPTVPSPAAGALAGLSGLLGIRRRRA